MVASSVAKLQLVAPNFARDKAVLALHSLPPFD